MTPLGSHALTDLGRRVEFPPDLGYQSLQDLSIEEKISEYYLAFDSQGVPPTVDFAVNAAGNQIEEGSRVLVDVTVNDDVQVRNAELLLDGNVVQTDGNFPFQFFFTAPLLANQASFTLAVRATDTGGNTTTTPEETFTLTPDVTPPVVVSTAPRANGTDFDVSVISVSFSEAIDPALLDVSGFTLMNLGADGLHGGGDDFPVAIDRVEVTQEQRVRVFLPTALSLGNYHLEIDPAMIADLAGNQLATPFSLFFGSQNEPPPGTVVWSFLGDGDWNDPNNWSSGVLPGPDDDVVIDVFGIDSIITHSVGNSTVKSVQINGDFTLDGGSVTVTEPSMVTGSFTMASNSSLIADGPNASFVANGPTSFDRANLFARNGGRISLPNATQYDGLDEIGQAVWRAEGAGSLLDLPALTTLIGVRFGPSELEIEALADGQINLPQITTIVQGSVEVLAEGPNSVVNLSALTQLDGDNSHLEARDAGTLQVSNLITLNETDLALDATGVLPLTQITTFTHGRLTLKEGRIVNLPNMTMIDRASFVVRGGAQLSLPNATQYDGLNEVGQALWRAEGTGSLLDLSALTTLIGVRFGPSELEIEALAGGQVNLSQIATIVQGSVEVLAEGPNSVVNLSALTQLDGDNSHLEARDAGTLQVSNLITLNETDLALDATGILPLTQITTFTRGRLTLTEGRIVNLPNMTMIDRASFVVRGGAQLSLPNATQYDGLNEVGQALWRAEGAGSLLDLSALTTLIGVRFGPSELEIEALAGGQVNLSQIATIVQGSVEVLAEGPNSLVNLSALTRLDGDNSHLEARAAGTVQVPNLMTLNETDLALDATGVLPLTQITTFTRGRLTLIEGLIVNLPNTMMIDRASFVVRGGAQLSLPNATQYDGLNEVGQAL